MIKNTSSGIEDNYGDLKYTGDEQFYVIYAEVFDRFLIPVAPGFVDVSDGIYTIIISRGTLINTGLNQTFLEGDLSDLEAEAPYLTDFQFSTDDYATGNSKKLIAGVLSGAILRSEFNSLLTLLTTNSTGQRFGNSIEVTDRLLELGLPRDLINLIPLQSFSNSATGEMSENFKEKVKEAVDAVINVAVDVLEFLAAGLVAIGDFLAKIVDIVASVGKKVLGAIEDAYDEVKDIVEKMDDIINQIVDFIKSQIQQVLETPISILVLLLQEFVNTIAINLIQIYRASTTASGSSVGNINLNQINLLEFFFRFISWLTTGSSLILVLLTIVVALKLVDLYAFSTSGGMAATLRFFRPLVKGIAITLIATFIINALGQIGITIAETVLGTDLFGGLESELGVYADFSVFGVTIINVLIGIGVRSAATRQAFGLGPFLSESDKELLLSLISLFAFILRFVVLQLLGNVQDGDEILGIPTVTVYSALVIILDLISLGAGVFAAFIGLEISGKVRRSLGLQFQVLNPILDVLPYIVLFLGIVGTVTDVVNLGSALIDFENENEE